MKGHLIKRVLAGSVNQLAVSHELGLGHTPRSVETCELQAASRNRNDTGIRYPHDAKSKYSQGPKRTR